MGTIRTLPDPSSEMNVTPMIDVMLVLLIIFMVVTPALTAVVQLPRAATAIPEKEDRVTLAIDARGGYLLENHGTRSAVPPGELLARLQAAYAARPSDHVLYLKADERVPYDRVLTAVDAARGAGVSRIATITEVERRP